MSGTGDACEELRRVLLARVPDAPRWVELRALLLEGSGTLFGSATGAGAVDAARELGVLWGDPGRQVVADMVAGLGASATVLAATRTACMPPGWGWERATLFTLADLEALTRAVAAPGPTVEHLSPAHLPLVPDDLRDELAFALELGQVACACEDERPVSFAFASWRTESWFDVSVDTLPRARGKGHARRVAATLVTWERALGREPVWGAVESNAASIAAARALGFSEVDRVWVATRSGGGPRAG